MDKNLIILQEDTFQVLLLNRMAARQMKRNKDDSLNINFKNNEATSIDLQAQVFASLSLEALKSYEISQESVKDHIRDSECNLSLEDIIHRHTKNKIKNSLIYKIYQEGRDLSSILMKKNDPRKAVDEERSE